MERRLRFESDERVSVARSSHGVLVGGATSAFDSADVWVMSGLLNEIPLWAVFAIFGGAVVVIALVGVRMAATADRLADRTGMGEAIAGALFLGGATSLPGLMTTTVTAWQGFPTLAVSNAVGGIAVQTLWLVLGDLFLRRANLEHSAASPENLLQGALLITLLAVPLLAMTAPPFTVAGGIHPASFALLAIWWFGMRLIREAKKSPMWHPEDTSATVLDEPDADSAKLPLGRLWTAFAAQTVALAGCGFLLAQTGSAITARTVLSESVMGGIFTGASSSIPELVVVIAAVRAGAHTMAVSNIIGGNALDTLFLLFADVAYTDGSIYHAVSRDQQFFLVLTLFMTGVLLMGLVRRQREGWFRIGFESVTILCAYVGAIVALVFMSW